MSAAMVAAQLVCVAAAAVMLVQSRTRRVRLAHLVMLVVMAALLVAHGVVAALASAVALAVAGAVLLVGRRRGDASCALDLAACAGLVALMGLSTLGRAGAHHAHHLAVSGGAASGQRWLVVALAGLVVLTWAALRTRLPDHPRGWPTSAPAWTMVAAMSAMAVM